MLTTLTITGTLISALIGGFLGFGRHTEPDPPVLFVAEFPHGTEELAFTNTEIRLNTDSGLWRFRLSDLRRITGTADELVVETRVGDIHRGVPTGWRLRYEHDRGTGFHQPGREMVNLQAARDDLEPERLPPHVELHMGGEQKVRVRRDEFRLPLILGDRQAEMDGATIRALRIIADSHASRTVIVSLPSGRVDRGRIEDVRQVLSVSDLFGNRVRIPLGGLRNVVAEREILAARPLSGSVRNDGRAVVRYRDGKTRAGSVDLAALKLHTDFGVLQIHSELLYHIESGAAGRFYVYTVTGERIQGRVRNEAFDLAIPGTAVERISYSEISHILFPGPLLPPPDGWMGATFANGDRLLVRFAEIEPPFAMPPGVEWTSINALTPAGRRAVKVDIQGAKHEARTAGSRVELVALNAADHIHVAWRDIERLAMRVDNFAALPRREPETPEARPVASLPIPSLTAPMAPVDAPARDRRAAPSRRTVLDVDTPWGQIALAAYDVVALHTADAKRILFLETNRGDCLGISIPRGRALDDLTGVLSIEALPNEGTVTLRSRTGLGDSTTPVWRFADGSVLLARPVTATLRFRQRGRVGGTLEIAMADIDEMARMGRDRFVLSTRQGLLDGRLLTDRLVVVPDVTARETTLNMATLESMSGAGIARLPPTMGEHRGLPSRYGNAVLIAGGSYMQGNSAADALPEETPAYPAVLSPFWMDRTLVTVAQFARFADDTGYVTTAEKQKRVATWREPGFEQTPFDPVTSVSWIDAAAYCNWRSRQAGLTPVYNLEARPEVETDRWADGFRLPTEAEWEFAARERGQNLIYPWGNHRPTETPLANYRQSPPEAVDPWLHTNPVRAFAPNSLGLYDMAGNVWEWCQDWFHENAYQFLRQRAPKDPQMTTPAPGNPRRSMRGGAFNTGLDFMRTTSRGYGHPLASSNHVGFRCVRSAETDSARAPSR